MYLFTKKDKLNSVVSAVTTSSIPTQKNISRNSIRLSKKINLIQLNHLAATPTTQLNNNAAYFKHLETLYLSRLTLAVSPLIIQISIS